MREPEFTDYAALLDSLDVDANSMKVYEGVLDMAIKDADQVEERLAKELEALAKSVREGRGYRHRKSERDVDPLLVGKSYSGHGAGHYYVSLLHSMHETLAGMTASRLSEAAYEITYRTQILNLALHKRSLMTVQERMKLDMSVTAEAQQAAEEARRADEARRKKDELRCVEQTAGDHNGHGRHRCRRNGKHVVDGKRYCATHVERAREVYEGRVQSERRKEWDEAEAAFEGISVDELRLRRYEEDRPVVRMGWHSNVISSYNYLDILNRERGEDAKPRGKAKEELAEREKDRMRWKKAGAEARKKGGLDGL